MKATAYIGCEPWRTIAVAGTEVHDALAALALQSHHKPHAKEFANRAEVKNHQATTKRISPKALATAPGGCSK